MKDAAPLPVHLADYRPFSHLIESVHLTFRLAPTATRVLSRIRFLPNPDAEKHDTLRLDGEMLTLISASIDGTPIQADVDASGLSVAVPDGAFTWDAEVEISPETNTALEGLYMSRGMYCTQCEAEGFRKITYYPDRPDVMAPFTVRIEGDGPVLLSNGNPGARGDGFAEWHDPWPKPAYLFALVAGDLVAHSDRFHTASGADVDLNIWVRPGDLDKCGYAMEALVRSMSWDEVVYGREYDLEVFNVVAVDDFNMGAMENKGLNIFNSKYVLASPQTATDRDFELIEGIIAHEYFHNWTGNRITCRDWFQLCLKEGLTVFRDQQFSADMRSAAVQRIESVVQLRARQFREDAGPLAHPVRPEEYIEINNFYTATVYEKGAEVIGMLHHMVGQDAYRRALDLYFDRHDGQACTIEQFRQCFEDVCEVDLTQFALWWSDPGTPRVTMTEDWEAGGDGDAADGRGTLQLTFTQQTSAAGRSDFPPRVIPLETALLGPDGAEVLAPVTIRLDQSRQSMTFPMLDARPTVSVNRGFSAPVIINRTIDAAGRAFLLAHDTDPYSRWEAGRALAKDVLLDMVAKDAPPDPAYLDALARAVTDDSADPAFRALVLGLPSDDDMAQTLFDAGVTPDPGAIHTAHGVLAETVARHLKGTLETLYAVMEVPGPYSPDAGAAGRRSLRMAALGLLTRIDDGRLARAQFDTADNMTETFGALSCLLRAGLGAAETADFYDRWKGTALVIDKWFMVQAALAPPDRAAALVSELSAHPDFDMTNPNRFRSLFGALAGNHAGLHHASGDAYGLIADWLLRLDPVNPQTAARMSGVFEPWRRYDADRQGMMQAALRRIRDTQGLSRDTGEMVGRLLGKS